MAEATLPNHQNKASIVEQFGQGANDTGSPEVQVALFTARILHLTEHMKANPKDTHSRRGLIQLVNKRRRLLRYLAHQDYRRYVTVTDQLNIRRSRKAS